MQTQWQGLPPASSVAASIALALQLLAQRQGKSVFLSGHLTA
jgi:hypothetical protein